MTTDEPKYWFRVKRYGWGWGLPLRWQGWVVFVTYLILVTGGIPFIDTAEDAVRYSVFVAALTVVLIAICWHRGEPPRWRWGERDP